MDAVPTHESGANSAKRRLSLLAHYLVRGFQVQMLALPSRLGLGIGLPRAPCLDWDPATKPLVHPVSHALAAQRIPV
jgi:hypothetical protein